MIVPLSPALTQHVERLIPTGRYANEAEVVREALRVLEHRKFAAFSYQVSTALPCHLPWPKAKKAQSVCQKLTIGAGKQGSSLAFALPALRQGEAWSAER